MDQKQTMTFSNNHVNGSSTNPIAPEVIVIDDDDDAAPGGYTESSPAKQPTVKVEHDHPLPCLPIVLGLPCGTRPQAAMESTKKRPLDAKDVNDFDHARSGPRPRVMNPAPSTVARTVNLGKLNKCSVMPVGKPPLPPKHPLPLSTLQLKQESDDDGDQSDEDIAEAAKKREGGAWVREFANELLKGAPLDLLVEKPVEMIPNLNYQDKSFHH